MNWIQTPPHVQLLLHCLLLTHQKQPFESNHIRFTESIEGIGKYRLDSLLRRWHRPTLIETRDCFNGFDDTID